MTAREKLIRNYDSKRILLTFELFIFYFSLLSMIFFLAVTRSIAFKTLRERSGYSLNLKHKQDYLYFVSEDIPWFLTIFAQFLLYIKINIRFIDRNDIDDDHSNVYGELYKTLNLGFRQILNLIIIYYVYFAK